MLYRIKDWNEHYENNRTRGMKAMQWVPVPNKHDGEGYLSLITQPDGMAIYGAWHLILQVASKCKTRGLLQKQDGTPHTAESIALKTHGDAETIERALVALCSAEVGWMECETSDGVKVSTSLTVCPQSARSLPAVCPHPADEEGRKEGRKEENGMEGKETHIASSQKSAIQPDEVFLTYPTAGKIQEWHLTKEFVAELKELYPAVDVQAESRAALGWIKTNPKKTASGMGRFLNGWMSRAQNQRSNNGTAKSKQDLFKTGANLSDFDSCQVPPG